MKNVKQIAQAGTVESGDIFVTVSPAETEVGIVVELDSLVFGQYGKQIKTVIEDTTKELGVVSVHVKAIDRGALDCTIRARVQTALSRAGMCQEGGRL